MALAGTAGLALGLTAVLALVARALRAVDTSGMLAGLVVGGLVSAAFGLPGLAPLGMFFVGGSLATRIGWAEKQAAGTAERGGGARDARRVLGKGGVAAAMALVALLWGPAAPGLPVAAAAAAAATGALAAALADTWGTELGALSKTQPRLIPSLRAVPPGTPGAVSGAGTRAALIGSVFTAGAAAAVALVPLGVAAGAAAAGFLGALLESLAVGIVPSAAGAPGEMRNLLTTGAGAVLGALAFLLVAP